MSIQAVQSSDVSHASEVSGTAKAESAAGSRPKGGAASPGVGPATVVDISPKAVRLSADADGDGDGDGH